MDEREVRSKSEALQKAISAHEPPANIINLLKDLQKGVKPSEELLRKTQVGKIVNKVKGLSTIDPAIPKLASEIVSQWRNVIQGKGGAAAAAKKENGASTPTRNGNASPAPGSTATTKTAKDEKNGPAESNSTSKYPTGVPLDKRTWKTDKINKGNLTPEPARNNSIGLLYDGLVIGSSLPPAKVLSIAKGIEASIIGLPDSNDTHTSDYYKERIRTQYSNLKDKHNARLRESVLNGNISPERFATMTHEEMKSDNLKKQDEKIIKKNFNDAMVPKDERSISDHLECGRCKQKMVSFTQAQTRSADEPMTTFCQCENCGNRWKFS